MRRVPAGIRLQLRDGRLQLTAAVINDTTDDKIAMRTSGNFTGQYWRFEATNEVNYYRVSCRWQGVDKVLFAEPGQLARLVDRDRVAAVRACTTAHTRCIVTRARAACTRHRHCACTAHAARPCRCVAAPVDATSHPTLSRSPTQRAPHPEQVRLLEQRIAAGGLTAPELIQLRNALAALVVALA